MTFLPSTVLCKVLFAFSCWIILKVRSLKVDPYYNPQLSNGRLEKRSVTFILKIHSEKDEKQKTHIATREILLRY